MKEYIIKPKKGSIFLDKSQRQTNLFSDVNYQNFIFINAPKSDTQFIADINQLPESVVKLIQNQFSNELLSDGSPIIKLISHDFFNEARDFYDFIQEDDNYFIKTICPHIDATYAGIFRAASYAKKLYSEGKGREGDIIRYSIGEHHGWIGRKLCNLYTKSYILTMFTNYLEKLFENATDKSLIGVPLNDLIEKILKFTENVFFIHHGHDDNSVIKSIRRAAELKSPYIAIHSAGSDNNKTAEHIVDEVKEILIENGYKIEQKTEVSSAIVPILDYEMKYSKPSHQS